VSRPGSRYCPLCEARLDAEVCPADQVPTVRDDFDRVNLGDAALGRVVAGRFTVERFLGEGASGRVYAALDRVGQKAVALKLLQPHHARDRVQVRRFYREARAASRLVGDHVVQVLEFGVDDETRTPYIAMELMEGESLRERLARDGAMEPRAVAALGVQVGRALVAAAEGGIVHRDLKPSNILVVPGAEPMRVKVADFGVAKDLARDTDTLTAEGAAVGTPSYMAPEQVSGGEVGPAADVYALGCLLFELLTGQPPFAKGVRAELYVDHLLTPAPALPDPLPTGVAAPPGLAALIARTLAKAPGARPSAAQVVRELAAIGAGPSATGRRRRGWAIGIGAAILAATGIALSAEPQRDDTAELTVARGATISPKIEADEAKIGTIRASDEQPTETDRARAAAASDERERGETDALAFDQLVVHGSAATLLLYEGPARALVIVGDARRIATTLDGTRLTVTIKPSDAPAELTVSLWAPSWRGLKVSGSARVVSATPLSVNDASFNIAGSARAELEVRGSALTTSVRGSSDVVLTGTVARHEVRTGGVARLDAARLETDETSLTAQGASDATVRAHRRLEARNDGTGEVVYFGAPSEVTRDGGSIRSGEPEPQPR
jgi:serine/threonine-protein kinase